MLKRDSRVVRRGHTDMASIACCSRVRQLAVALGMLSLIGAGLSAAQAATVWGFTPFPYDFTTDAVKQTYARTSKLATVFAIHRDNGVPWQEALEDGKFPQEMRDQWNEHASNRPKNQTIYVGLAPLATDRESLAPSAKGSKTAMSFLRKSLQSKEVKQAYLNYVRRAVETFHPDYLNIGIEVGELAKHSKSRWKDFEVLYDYVRTAIKKQYPSIQIGVSFGLYTLMDPTIAERSRQVVESSDYIGISYYPFVGTPDQVKPPPAQWRDPLDWLRKYTSKPIAMVETGYSSTDVMLKSPEMHLQGSPKLQQQYLSDLAAVAKRDNYVMVNWFLLIDHDALSERAGLKAGDGSRLWEHIGLLDRHMRPKPAMATWEKIMRGQIDVAPAATMATVSPAASTPTIAAAVPFAGGSEAQARYKIGFNAPADIFKGSNDDRLSLIDDGPDAGTKAMSWVFTYKSGRFQWGMRDVQPGALAGAAEMSLTSKSSQPSYILVTVQEDSGESYWTVLKTGDDWETQTLSFANFQRDEKKPKDDGVLQVDKIVSVLIADARALEGASGAQQIWIANWIVR